MKCVLYKTPTLLILKHQHLIVIYVSQSLLWRLGRNIFWDRWLNHAHCKNVRNQHLIPTHRLLNVIVQQNYLIGVRRVRPKTQRAWLPSMPKRLLHATLYLPTVLKQKIKQDFALNAKQTSFLRGIMMRELKQSHRHLSASRSVLVQHLTRTLKTKIATARKEQYT